MAWECLETQGTAYRLVRSVFGIASVFAIEVQIKVGQYLGSVGQYLGSKLTGFEIEFGLTGTENKHFNW